MRFDAVILAAAAMLPAAAPAQTATYYVAVPATAPTEAKVVTRTTVWNCNGTACAAPKASTRDALMCQLVAREIGTLRSFRAGAEEADAAALERCNARAR